MTIRSSQNGARQRITETFLRLVQEEWDRNGTDIVARLAKNHPEKFCALAASLLPKSVETERPLDGVSDDELAALIADFRARSPQPDRSGAH